MARGRMLSTTIAGDQRLNSLSIEAEYLFLKAVPHLDRDGLIYGKANLLWAKACPERMELLPRIDALVTEWVQKSLVLRYETADGPVLYFYGFRKNQTGIRYDREAASIFAPPPGYIRKDGKDGGLFTVEEAAKVTIQTDDEPDTDDGQTDAEPATDELPTNSGVTPDEIPLKAKESKVNQSKLNKGESNAAPSPDARVAKQPHQKHVATMTALNAKLDAKTRVSYVDPIATYLGLKDLIDADDESDWLVKIHNSAITINKMGVTVEHLRRWWKTWNESYLSNNPTIAQFEKFCSEQLGKSKKQPVMQTEPVAMGKVVDYPFSL